MEKAALNLARTDFDRAFQSMTDLAGTDYFSEIERHWSAFLVSAHRVCTKLESASKPCPKASPWWGRKRHEIRNDPLLSYVWHARNADEHGLHQVTQKHPGAFTLVPPTPERPIGEVQVTYPHIYLVDVVDRGVTYPVPNSHGGGPISKAHPNNVGLLALRFLEECLKEAEQFTTDQKLSSSPP